MFHEKELLVFSLLSVTSTGRCSSSVLNLPFGLVAQMGRAYVNKNMKDVFNNVKVVGSNPIKSTLNVLWCNGSTRVFGSLSHRSNRCRTTAFCSLIVNAKMYSFWLW